MEEHVMELRRSVAGQRILYWSLVISFVVGLAAFQRYQVTVK